jgi:Protein of unknown function (DUF1566)
MTTARARLLSSALLMVLGCAACDAVLGLTGVPSEATGEGGLPVIDSGIDAPAIAQDSGPHPTTPDTGVDATVDGGPDSGPDSGPVMQDSGTNDLSWAEWPMPNSPRAVEAGAPNLESYTLGEDSGAVTVTDNVTKLVWQQTPIGDAGVPYPMFSWDDAMTYCSTLDLAGQHDWRLPTVIELVSLVEYDVVLPAISRSYFPGEPGNHYWSATPYAGYSDSWFVDFSSGLTSVDDPTTLYGARCVRGGEGAPFATPSDTPVDHYVALDGGDAVFVYDTRTKLTWQQTPTLGGTPNPTMTQADATGYCASVALNGAPGRVPTLAELETLFDYNATTIAATDPTFFPTAVGGKYWSSTAEADVPDASWGVPFGIGGTFIDPPGAASYVRCVR